MSKCVSFLGKTTLIFTLLFFTLLIKSNNQENHMLDIYRYSDEYNECLAKETTCIITIYNTSDLSNKYDSPIRNLKNYTSHNSTSYFSTYNSSDLMLTAQAVGYPEIGFNSFLGHSNLSNIKYTRELRNVSQHTFRCCPYNDGMIDTMDLFIKLTKEEEFYENLCLAGLIAIGVIFSELFAVKK